MDAVLTGFFILSGIASILALVRRSDRRKLLAYDISPRVSIARLFRGAAEAQLALVYRSSDDEPREVEGAFVRFVRIGNFGREPIKYKEDVPGADPVRITVKGSPLLEMALEARHRETTACELTPTELREGVYTSELRFEFLDHNDGALVRILTEGYPVDIEVVGTVLGMPEGIRSIHELRNPVQPVLGRSLSVALYLGFFAAAALLVYQTTGDWWKVWLLALPIAAIVIPTVIIVAVGETIWPRTKWAAPLSWPSWFPFHVEYTLAGEPPMLDGGEVEDARLKRKRESGRATPGRSGEN